MAGTRHDRMAGLWLEPGMTGELFGAETRHDRRAACPRTRHNRRAALWLVLGMTEGLLVAGTRHDKMAAFGWN